MKRTLTGIMILFLLVSCARANLLQVSEATMSVTPTQLTVTPGQSFTISIIVNNVDNLNDWQVALKYNASIVNCTAAWIPQNDVFANHTVLSVVPELNDPTIDGHNYSLYGNGLFSGSVNVSQGILCKLNFTCQGLGSTFLQLGTQSNPIMSGNIYHPTSWYSELLDPDGNDLVFATEDGVVNKGLQSFLTILSTSGGTTDPPPGNYSETNGVNASATALPAATYAFDHWLLDGYNAGSANPITILMNANHTLEPVFAQINYTLTVVDVPGGNTSMLPGTYSFTAGSPVQLSATAYSGYVFSYWILDGYQVGSSNPLLVTMNGNQTLMPIFVSTSLTYVYIRADGSIDPMWAPLLTTDNVTYNFVGDMSSTITVQRSNITINGAGHSLQGTGSGDGIRLTDVNNVSITSVNIRGFDNGIDLSGSSEDTISKNNITANAGLGISLYNSSNNTLNENDIVSNKGEGVHLDYSSNYNNILGNNIEDNGLRGTYIDSSSDNFVYHNNFINNTNQVYVAGPGFPPNNSWDDGTEGNYWSNYFGADLDADGIGDTPYVIDVNNTDHFPLIGNFSTFDTISGYSVSIISNSTITDLSYSSLQKARALSFNVSGEDGTIGFCELTIPHDLIDVQRMEILIDNGDTPVLFSNLTLRDNVTHRWVIFYYEQSTHAVLIQEDWTPPTIILLNPENKSYPSQNVSLDYTVSEQTSWEGYSLDGSVNVTISGNQTLSDIPDGTHSIIVYANDSAGNMGSSDTVFFMIDTTPPNIVLLVQTPPGSSVLPGEMVTIDVTVTDNVTRVESVDLNCSYANSSGSFAELISMTNLQGDVWNATIPGFPNGTDLTYTIIAQDNAGNTITTQKQLDFEYPVLPEHLSLIVPLLPAAWFLLAVALAKKAKEKKLERKTQRRQTQVSYVHGKVSAGS